MASRARYTQLGSSTPNLWQKHRTIEGPSPLVNTGEDHNVNFVLCQRTALRWTAVVPTCDWRAGVHMVYNSSSTCGAMPTERCSNITMSHKHSGKQPQISQQSFGAKVNVHRAHVTSLTTPVLQVARSWPAVSGSHCATASRMNMSAANAVSS